MAGETVSLDYTPATVQPDGKVVESETPLYPGYQVAHIGLDDGRSYAWVVERVTQRISEMDARRGIFQQVYTYPGAYATRQEAEATARAHFLADGPGDMGGRNPQDEQARAAEAQQVHAALAAQEQRQSQPALSDQQLAAALQRLGVTRPSASLASSASPSAPLSYGSSQQQS